MKILIVDDSRLARKELIELLTQLELADTLLEAADVASAVAAIDHEKPDLVLLDIHLPDGDGFDVLEKSQFTPQIIFTTAYEQHALQAFEYNALDYLLKPISAERLKEAIARAQAKISSPKSTQKTQEQFFIRDGDKCHFVKVDDIYLVNVEGNYVRLFFRDTKAFLARSLAYVEEKLSEAHFFRANRQQIINLNYIQSMEPAINDGLLVFLKDGTEIEISRRQAKELKQRLEF